jgi:hypothetical protein
VMFCTYLKICMTLHILSRYKWDMYTLDMLFFWNIYLRYVKVHIYTYSGYIYIGYVYSGYMYLGYVYFRYVWVGYSRWALSIGSRISEFCPCLIESSEHLPLKLARQLGATRKVWTPMITRVLSLFSVLTCIIFHSSFYNGDSILV